MFCSSLKATGNWYKVRTFAELHTAYVRSLSADHTFPATASKDPAGLT